MKKLTKNVLIASLSAAAFAGVTAGATFALFTDKAETSVSVEAGRLDIESDLKINAISSLNANDANNTIAENKRSAQWTNGGTANITVDNETGRATGVALSALTPGDKIVIDCTPSSTSNIAMKLRLKVTFSGDLAPALTVGIVGGASIVRGGYPTNNMVKSDWTLVRVGHDEDLVTQQVSIEFPNTENDITEREDQNHGDNRYQEKSANVVIAFEAVQGNANTTNL